MTDAERKRRLLELWMERPEEEHAAETGPLLFYQWVQEHHPELLVTGHGDPYQHLRVDLIGDTN
jgi:hypothetical protein